jgi:predicted nucleic acid-binding protein
VIGSLRVLKEAKDRGIIPEVKSVLDKLIAAGMYVSDALYQKFLQETGEA